MNRWLLLALGLTMVTPARGRATTPMSGDWIGGFRSGDGWASLRFRIDNGADSLRGTALLQHNDVYVDTLVVRGAPGGGRSVRFTATGAVTFDFEGRLGENIVRGRVRADGARKAFELLRMHHVEWTALQRYVGAWRLGPDQVVAFGRHSEGDGSDPRIRVVNDLGYADSFTGRGGDLIALSEGEFAFGPAIGVDYPPDVRVRFSLDPRGEVSGMRWMRGDTSRVATRIPLRAEDVRYSSGDITLAGTVVLPAGPGPHPAVVLIHGSTPLTRYYFSAAPYLLAAYGVAALCYDKRGCGESTGRFGWNMPIETLAADALAGVRLLKGRADVDSTQIGVVGHSQGGWVAPAAAAMSHDVAFVVAGAASGLTTQDNAANELDGELKYAGMTDDERAHARALYQQGTRVILSGGEGWNEWRDSTRACRGQRWFPAYSQRRMGSFMAMNDSTRGRILEWIANQRRAMFDPVPVWEKVSVPVLVYEGELDRSVPAQESATIIQGALQRSGNRDFTVHVFPRASHGLWVVDTGGPKDRLSVSADRRFVRDWILRHVRVAR